MNRLGKVLQVAVVAPIDHLFDYLPPLQPLINNEPVRGLRLWLPFGKRECLGILWNIANNTECPEDKLKPALEWIDSEPLWSKEDLELLAWTAQYYVYPLGEVLATALPTKLRRKTAITQIAKAKQGWIESCTTLPQVLKSGNLLNIGPKLNADQDNAITTIKAAFGKYQAFLLEGITGSGKTEVYLRLLEHILAQHAQALILVPEIGLTPQMQQRLLERFNTKIALLHSNRSENTRAADWQAARTGVASIVLGTRTAIFTPLPRLALIIVDEEHDPSFKQHEGLLYSARDIAVWRAWQRHCPVVLGSATPSLETVQNAILNRYSKLELPKRAGAASSPKMDLIDISATKLQAGLSPALIRLLKDNLEAKQQSLLFLNRRGYAPLLRCYNCGWTAECEHCDARLTTHQKLDILWCHHCGTQQATPKQCPKCQNTKLKFLGQGTERLEQTLTKLFKDISLVRIDRDTTSKKNVLEQLLKESQAGIHPIILGTQMLAKGHHFPAVTLVGILDLDQGLYGSDYRATERMAQLLMQVSGRAGRVTKPGRVVIQTYHPEHILLQTLIHKGYRAFAQLALKERHEARLPPFTAQVLLRADGTKLETAMSFLTDAANLGKELPTHSKIEFWGPAPAIMAKLAKRYRAQLLIQAENRNLIRKFLADYVPKLRQLTSSSKVRWTLDVDPQEVS